MWTFLNVPRDQYRGGPASLAEANNARLVEVNNKDLYSAVESRDLDGIKAVLNRRSCSQEGLERAFYMAVTKGSLECVELFLDKKHWAEGKAFYNAVAVALDEAACEDQLECLKVLLECLKVLCDKENSVGFRSLALRTTARCGHLECAKVLLNEGGYSPNVTDSVLYKASSLGNRAYVELLLDEGDCSQEGKDKALYVAASRGHRDCEALFDPVEGIHKLWL